ncbi:hypothetical protein GCM10025862_09460 [Arsenicicoccus piscis]|uniref:Uncharacterized protein n=1 Tax=Arsenicicoccus piscis TaxID=673954 RepID=A0ABQ6HKI7_9MICO|nr:hypothetical protein GCM10025862_09460 [Arsenicicoccus piscis]
MRLGDVPGAGHRHRGQHPTGVGAGVPPHPAGAALELQAAQQVRRAVVGRRQQDPTVRAVHHQQAGRQLQRDHRVGQCRRRARGGYAARGGGYVEHRFSVTAPVPDPDMTEWAALRSTHHPNPKGPLWASWTS